jgi:protein SCO1
MKVFWSLLLLTLFGVSASGESTLPSDSIYQLNVALTSQADKNVKLDVYRGQPTLITMFYGSCPNVCPLLISTMQSMEQSLSTKERNSVRVLMVSIDPERDTPAALTTLAKNHRIDLSRWTLARASAADVRKLAAVLNIQYRKLPNGEFNHSSVITLLDSTGRSLTSTSRLGGTDDEFMKALKSALP